MIKWKEGAVCFASGCQWFYDFGKGRLSNLNGGRSITFSNIVKCVDFQLNEIRKGDYIEASELDVEQKYDDAVEVFELFGFWWADGAYTRFEGFKQPLILRIGAFGITQSKARAKGYLRKITCLQLIAIGKLKRAMIERDEVKQGKLKHSVIFKSSPLDVSGFNTIEQSIEKRVTRKKPRQAYDILESLDYEYDLVKQQWYKKQYV